MRDDLLRKDSGETREPIPPKRRALPGASSPGDDLLDPSGTEAFERSENRDDTFYGKGGRPVDVKNITGLFEVVSAAPTHIPKNLYDQIKLYVNGATYRIYFYDYTGAAWRLVS